jgi:hypothetical protein
MTSDFSTTLLIYFFFCLNDQLYEQTGLPLAHCYHLFANFFMEEFEEVALSNMANKPICWLLH